MNPTAAIRSLLFGVRSRVASEAGFTLIEVMIGALMAVIVIGASAELFTKANDSSLASQRQSELVAVADQQIETIRQNLKTNTSGFSALAMNAVPSAPSNSTLPYGSAHTDPNDFVSSSPGCGTTNEGYLIETNYDNASDGPAPGLIGWTGCATGAEPLVIQTGTGIITPSRPITIGSDSGTVYTYVTNTYAGCNSLLANCSTASGDARRVIVAVVLSNGGAHNTGTNARYNIGPNAPVYVSTIFANPVPSNQPNSSIGLTVGLSIG